MILPMKTNLPQLLTHAATLWLCQQAWVSQAQNPSQDYPVLAPPASMKAPDFYSKYVDAKGYPVLASDQVDDYAVKEAAYLIDRMLHKRPEIKDLACGSTVSNIILFFRL